MMDPFFTPQTTWPHNLHELVALVQPASLAYLWIKDWKQKFVLGFCWQCLILCQACHQCGLRWDEMEISVGIAKTGKCCLVFRYWWIYRKDGNGIVDKLRSSVSPFIWKLQVNLAHFVFWVVGIAGEPIMFFLKICEFSFGVGNMHAKCCGMSHFYYNYDVCRSNCRIGVFHF